MPILIAVRASALGDEGVKRVKLSHLPSSSLGEVGHLGQIGEISGVNWG